jgi:two-component system, NarL family, response regulator LiaR
MPVRPIQVLIVDDHALVRKGTQAMLAEIEHVVVVGEAENGREAVAQAETLQPDVILMDLVMPEMDGIEAIRQILARQPEIRILALTSFATDDKVLPAIRAGALGYFLKDSDPEKLVEAIQQVYRGEPSLPAGIARQVMRALSPVQPSAPIPEPLTEREIEVLRLVAQGLNDQVIASRMSITEVTVRSHISNILHKLFLDNRVQATLYALREGLVSLE